MMQPSYGTLVTTCCKIVTGDIEVKLGLHRFQVDPVQGFKGYTDTLKYLGPYADVFSTIMSHTTLQRMEASEDCAFDVLLTLNFTKAIMFFESVKLAR